MIAGLQLALLVVSWVLEPLDSDQPRRATKEGENRVTLFDEFNTAVSSKFL